MADSLVVRGHCESSFLCVYLLERATELNGVIYFKFFLSQIGVLKVLRA